MLQVKDIIESLSYLNPDSKCLFSFQEYNAEKTFEAVNIEVKNNCVYLHGRVSMAIYQQLSDYESFICDVLLRDIEMEGVACQAIKKMIIDEITKSHTIKNFFANSLDSCKKDIEDGKSKS